MPNWILLNNHHSYKILFLKIPFDRVKKNWNPKGKTELLCGSIVHYSVEQNPLQIKFSQHIVFKCPQLFIALFTMHLFTLFSLYLYTKIFCNQYFLKK